VRGLVSRIRRHTDLPILVGFGISKPEHVSEVAQFADGVAVGSALIDTIESASGDPAAAAAEFAASLRGNVE
jgi:tryptophan synthase alpha chain